MIQIDVEAGQSVTQVLQLSLLLSTLTGQSFQMLGAEELGEQHHLLFTALDKLCGAQVEMEASASSFIFTPGTVVERTFQLNVERICSIPSVLHLLLPLALSVEGKLRIKLKGGTDSIDSISWDYLSDVVAPLYQSVTQFEFKNLERGFHPDAKGKVELIVRSKHKNSLSGKLQSLRLASTPEIVEVRGRSVAADSLKTRRVVERQITGARQALEPLGIPVSIQKTYVRGGSTGTAITLWALCKDQQFVSLGSFAVGAREKKAEEVGAEAGEALLQDIQSGAACDKNLLETLLPILAIAGGELYFPHKTGYLNKALSLVPKFLPSTVSYSSGIISSEGSSGVSP